VFLQERLVGLAVRIFLPGFRCSARVGESSFCSKRDTLLEFGPLLSYIV